MSATYTSSIESPDGADLIDRLQPVLGHWRDIRGEQEMPRWGQWNWLQLPVDVIPWCAVVDVIGRADDFRHRFWGTARRDLFDTDFTGKLVSEMVPDVVAKKSAQELTETYARRAPTYITTTEYDFGGRPTQYHMLRLPFADAQSVTHILSAVVFERGDIESVNKFMTESP